MRAARHGSAGAGVGYPFDSVVLSAECIGLNPSEAVRFQPKVLNTRELGA
jgi:hypothetical protein